MKIRFVEAFAVRVPRDIGAATGLAGSPTVLAGGKGDYRWSQDYSALYSTNFAPCDGRPFIFVSFHLEGIRIGPQRIHSGSSQFPGSNPSGGLDRARKRQRFANRTLHGRAGGEPCEKHRGKRP